MAVSGCKHGLQSKVPFFLPSFFTSCLLSLRSFPSFLCLTASSHPSLLPPFLCITLPFFLIYILLSSPALIFSSFLCFLPSSLPSFFPYLSLYFPSVLPCYLPYFLSPFLRSFLYDRCVNPDAWHLRAPMFLSPHWTKVGDRWHHNLLGTNCTVTEWIWWLFGWMVPWVLTQWTCTTMTL